MKYKCSYYGSIKDKYQILIRDEYFETTAASLSQGISRILSQAKSKLHLNQSAKLYLCHPEEVEYYIIEDEYDKSETVNKCPNCGSELTDGGYCPVCYAAGDEICYL